MNGDSPYKRASRLAALLDRKTIRGKNRLAEFLDYADWERVVGPHIAGHCSPGPIFNRELLLYVENSLWMNELQMMKEEILSGIRKAFPRKKIETLRFRLGTVYRRQPAPAQEGPSEEVKPQPEPDWSESDRELLDKAEAAIKDASLKKALRSFMVKHLARRK